MNQKYDVIILGAGAAGLMCAMEAGKRGRRVLLLERADRIGKKILISGGGRCNFTNLHTSPDNFLSANRHFAKCRLAERKLSGLVCRFVKLQRPPPEIKIFLPMRSARSNSRTRLPRFPASMAHIRPAAPAPRMMTSYF